MNWTLNDFNDLLDAGQMPSYDQLRALLTQWRDAAEAQRDTYHTGLYGTALMLLEDEAIAWEDRLGEIITTLRQTVR
jgi:hypothetical protein